MNAQTHFTAITIGRILLGVYFLLPGIMKFVEWDRHIALMQHHDIGYTSQLLLIATVANILLGVLLIANHQVRLAAYGCVAYIVVINFTLHDFWNFEGMEGAHELQNFVKNIGILAGLLVLAGYSPNRR
ncbi:MAG: DoxX family protein [Parvibaculales bacterium]|jgi:putative oxidoreductase